MIDKKMLIALTEEYLENSPNYLVDLLVGTDNTITVEIDNDKGVDIDDCVALSRHLESKLDRDAEDFEKQLQAVLARSPRP